MKSFFGFPAYRLIELRMLGTDADDSFTAMSVNEVIFGGSSDDVLLAMEWSFPLSKSEMVYCSQQMVFM